MVYRLGTDELASQGAARIIEEQLDAAASELSGETDHDFNVVVHTARKAFKKARAGLRLVRAGLDRDVYRDIDRSLRDAGRSLSATRDRAVEVHALDVLLEHVGGALSPGAYASMRARLVVEPGATTEPALEEAQVAAVALDQVEEARAALGRMQLNDSDELVLAGVRAAYKRARRRGRKAERSPTRARLHEWRKRVKDVWYHLRLMDEAWPEVLGPLAAQARALSELLGDDHDLALLRDTLVAAPGLFDSPADQATLLDLLDGRRAQLQADAFALGRRLHAEKAKGYADRVAAYRAAARDATP